MLVDDVVTALGAALATVGSYGWTESELTAAASPPRFVFVPKSIEERASKSTRSTAGTTKIQGDRHVVSVHCWGADTVQCQRMRQALITAARTVSKNLGVEIVTSGIAIAEWSRESLQTDGLILTMPIAIDLALVAAAMPAHLGDPVTDATDETVKIERVAFDPTNAATGNGKLSAAGDT